MTDPRVILLLQFIAALLMATDYFFDDKQRGVINAKLQSLAKPVQDRVDEDLRSYWVAATQQWAKIFVSLVFAIGAFLITLLAPHIKGLGAPILLALLALFSLFLLAGSLPFLTGLLVQTVVPVTLAASLRSVTWFLIRCPKGTVFGIGFLFLLASFALRYLALES